MYNLVEVEAKIVEWAKERNIIPNSNIMTQGIKTLEEVQELLRAIDRDDKDEIADAYGDIFVTIVIGAHLNGGSLSEYANGAYGVIKDRTGTLLPNGDFVKDTHTLKKELITDIKIEQFPWFYYNEWSISVYLDSGEDYRFSFTTDKNIQDELVNASIGKTLTQFKAYLRTVGELK